MAWRKPAALLSEDELKSYAARLLGARALSTAELKERLRRRAASETNIDSVIAALRELGYLNDRRFAEGFAGVRREARNYGRQRVFADLLKKKVAPKVAQLAVERAFAGADEHELVADYLSRKYRGKDLGALLREPGKLASVYRRLRQAGFSGASSIAVLKRHAAAAGQLDGLEESESGE